MGWMSVVAQIMSGNREAAVGIEGTHHQLNQNLVSCSCPKPKKDINRNPMLVVIEDWEIIFITLLISTDCAKSMVFQNLHACN